LWFKSNVKPIDVTLNAVWRHINWKFLPGPLHIFHCYDRVALSCFPHRPSGLSKGH